MAKSGIGFYFRSRVHRAIADQYMKPTKGFGGWVVSRLYRKNNSFLEKNAVALCKIQPHHKVLEIGFGTDVGLLHACRKVQDGSGTVCGVDISEYAVENTLRSLRHFVNAGKLDIVQSSVVQMPFQSHTFDRVFHCNCYYYWIDPFWACAEIYRVVKPGGLVVTTMDVKQDKQHLATGLLGSTVSDLVLYMHALEGVGFCDVHLEYLKDVRTGREFQAIFANAATLEKCSSEE